MPTAAYSTVSTHTVHASYPCWLLAVPTAQSLWWFFSHFQGFHLAHPFSTSQRSTTPYNSSYLLYITAWQIMVLHTILTSPDVTVQWQDYFVNIHTTDFKYLAVTHTTGCLKRSTVYKIHKHLARNQQGQSWLPDTGYAVHRTEI